MGLIDLIGKQGCSTGIKIGIGLVPFVSMLVGKLDILLRLLGKPIIIKLIQHLGTCRVHSLQLDFTSRYAGGKK